MKTKIEKVINITLFLFLFPAFSLAAESRSLASIANKILGVIRIFPKLLIALALAYFLYGAFSYVSTGADEKKRKESRDTIVYGLLGLFVMVSIWGIVDLFVNALGLK